MHTFEGLSTYKSRLLQLQPSSSSSAFRPFSYFQVKRETNLSSLKVEPVLCFLSFWLSNILHTESRSSSSRGYVRGLQDAFRRGLCTVVYVTCRAVLRRSRRLLQPRSSLLSEQWRPQSVKKKKKTSAKRSLLFCFQTKKSLPEETDASQVVTYITDDWFSFFTIGLFLLLPAGMVIFLSQVLSYVATK